MIKQENSITKEENSITDDIARGVYDMNYNNIHEVAEYMHKKLGRSTVEALIFELVAQIRFGIKE